MRSGIWLIAFVSAAAWAHGPEAAHPDAQPPGHAAESRSNQSTTGAGNQISHHIDPASRQGSNAPKSGDDRPRFCVRNHIGEVNCVVYPAAGH